MNDVQDHSKRWDMWQYLSEVNFEDWSSTFGVLEGEDQEFNLWEICYRIWSLVMSFNWLEAELESCICECISDRTDDIWMMYVCELSYKQKIDLLIKVYKRSIVLLDKDESLLEDCDTIRSALNAIWSFRNNVVHARWYTITETKHVRVKAKYGLDWVKFNYKKFSNEIFDKRIELIERTETNLDDLHWKTYPDY